MNTYLPFTKESQEIPRIFRGSLYLVLILGAVLGVPALGGFSPIPMTAFLDIWMVGFIAYCLFRGKIVQHSLFVLLLVYSLTRIIPLLISGVHLHDSGQAYRWLLYLIGFVLAVGRNWGQVKPLVVTTWVVLALAVTKAVLSRFLVDFLGVTSLGQPVGNRPGLFVENNFEIALFAGALVVLYEHLGRSRPWAVGMLGLLTLLSGSRSGSVAFVIFAFYAVTRVASVRGKVGKRQILLMVSPLLAFVPLVIFLQRAEEVRIDRLNFLDAFLYEVKDWTILNWLFGTPPLTPLTDACYTLASYVDLFSSAGDGACYAVILHAFVLRVIFDAGLFGFFLCFGVIWLSLRKSGVSIGLALALVLLALTNSFSVSGPNNPYVALPELLAILLANRRSLLEAS